MSGRTHSVTVGSTLSHPTMLQYGVPQGYVLGSILFSLYTNPISSIIHSHSSVNYHFYANDTQLYITLSPANFPHSIQKLGNCLPFSLFQSFLKGFSCLKPLDFHCVTMSVFIPAKSKHFLKEKVKLGRWHFYRFDHF